MFAHIKEDMMVMGIYESFNFNQISGYFSQMSKGCNANGIIIELAVYMLWKSIKNREKSKVKNNSF